MTTYQNMLANDAFANFSTIMKDVTLSPAMGAYLNMLNSNKPGIVNGVPQIANENYARELMQLFSTGLVYAESGWNATAGWQRESRYRCTRRHRCRRLRRAYTGWTLCHGDRRHADKVSEWHGEL